MENRTYPTPRYETRKKVLATLGGREGGLTFTELISETKLSRDTVSRCLRFLKNTGTVEKREGRWVLKKPSEEAIKEIKIWIESLKDLDENLRAVMFERLPSILKKAGDVEAYNLIIKEALKILESDKILLFPTVLSLLQEVPTEFLNPHKDFLENRFLKFAESHGRSFPKAVEEGIKIFDRILDRGAKPAFGEKLLRIAVKNLSGTGFNSLSILPFFPDKPEFIKALIKIYNEEGDTKVKITIMNFLRQIR